jgi:hypothetical protein
MEVILPALLAGRFAGLYSFRKTGYVLNSARVLGASPAYSTHTLKPLSTQHSTRIRRLFPL